MTEVLTQDIFKLKTADQILHGLKFYCIVNNCSFAAWRMPLEQEIYAIVNFSEGNDISEGNQLEDLETGFICAPFDRSKEAYFIRADVKISFGSRTVQSHPEHAQRCEELVEYISGLTTPILEEVDNSEEYHGSERIEEETHFKDLVKRSIEGISNNLFQKVVPSRVKKIELRKHFNPTTNFIRLCEAYTNAFVSLLYSPKTGLWLGATPELLIKTNHNSNIFETIALAGTQRFDENCRLADVAWTQKEIEEQALVSRYIINCFKKIRLREFNEIGPKTVKAGNLIHLKTTFSVDMKATDFPSLGSVMLDLLHPTSAICGMPMDTSLRFLKELEGYDRKLFSGYIGPIDNQSETSLFVNLRCMEIAENEAYLYAGAGVTEDSDPDKEWLETEMKMKTLLNIIR